MRMRGELRPRAEDSKFEKGASDKKSHPGPFRDNGKNSRSVPDVPRQLTIMLVLHSIVHVCVILSNIQMLTFDFPQQKDQGMQTC